MHRFTSHYTHIFNATFFFFLHCCSNKFCFCSFWEKMWVELERMGVCYCLVLSSFVLSCLVFVRLFVGMDVGYEGREFCGVMGLWKFFLKTLYWFIIMWCGYSFSYEALYKWVKWRGLVDRPLLYVMFSPTTGPKYRAIKKKKKGGGDFLIKLWVFLCVRQLTYRGMHWTSITSIF